MRSQASSDSSILIEDTSYNLHLLVTRSPLDICNDKYYRLKKQDKLLVQLAKKTMAASVKWSIDDYLIIIKVFNVQLFS